MELDQFCLATSENGARRKKKKKSSTTVRSQSLYAGHDGVERRLDVRRAAGAHHGQVVVLEHIRQVLKGEQKVRLERELRKRSFRGQLTCPCQSDVLMRIMLSGSWLSDTRMWLSWSYTVFLGICTSISALKNNKNFKKKNPSIYPLRLEYFSAGIQATLQKVATT